MDEASLSGTQLPDSNRKRKSYPTQRDLNDDFGTILHVLLDLDRGKTLIHASVENGKDIATLPQIQKKIKEAQYANATELKHDVSGLTLAAIRHSSTDDGREHAKKLHALAVKLIDDKSQCTVRSHGKKVRSREESQAGVPQRDHEKLALFQRTADGLVFTSASDAAAESTELDIAHTMVVPVASMAKPPLLRDINSRPRPLTTTSDQSKKLTVGVEYCQYNPFTSFAPFIDSSNAALNAEDTATAYEAVEVRHDQKPKSLSLAAKAQINSMVEMAQQLGSTPEGRELGADDILFLAEEGLDIKALLGDSATAMDISTDESSSLSALEAIQTNAILLFELQQLQEQRFASKNQEITAHEHELVARVKGILLDLTGKVTPSKLVSAKTIQEMIQKIPYKEPAFQGTLPPTKPFAFPTNTTRNGVSPTANAYPTHNPVATKKPSASSTLIPQVALSHHMNLTGGYPSIPQPSHHSYAVPQPPTHQKTYSRPRTNAYGNGDGSIPQPLQVGVNGDFTFRKNFHMVTTTGGTPSHWRKNDSQIPCFNCKTLVSPIWRLGARNEKLCNACGQYNKKWNGQQRPISLFPNTETPTFRK